MFKAQNLVDGSEINILATRWDGDLAQLRALGLQDQLVCPGCKRAVRVRVPRYRRRHFAHKHLQHCPHANASAELLEARAVLYHWLEQHTNRQVEIEKLLPDLAQPLDCWVESEHGRFAYLILPGNLHPEKRAMIKAALSKSAAQAHWLFLAPMLRMEEGRLDRIFLTTTEREFAQQTAYDQNQSGPDGQTLHYLDPQQQSLITYRGLICVHAPQLYQGRFEQHPLTEIKLSPFSGELFHPDEQARAERMQQLRQRRETEAARRTADRLETVQRFFKELAHSGTKAGNQDNQRRPNTSNEARPAGALESEQPDQTSQVAEDAGAIQQLQKLINKQAVCIFCGQLTNDYWYLNQADGTCKCRQCYRAGKH